MPIEVAPMPICDHAMPAEDVALQVGICRNVSTNAEPRVHPLRINILVPRAMPLEARKAWFTDKLLKLAAANSQDAFFRFVYPLDRCVDMLMRGVNAT